MTENKFTSRQFIFSLLFFFVIMFFAWSTLGIVSEGTTEKCLYLAGLDVFAFCFNDILKKIIDLIPALKGFFNKSTDTE